MKIYVIGGKARTGKNTFGKYLKEELEKKGYHPCIMQLTTPLYLYAKTYFGWDGKEETKPREILQKLGIEWIQEKLGKKDFLVNRLLEDIEILKNFFDTFIITDARLTHEIDRIKASAKDVMVIKIERENQENGLTEEEKKHRTETEIDEYQGFDIIIKNEKEEDLKFSAKTIVEKEGGTYE